MVSIGMLLTFPLQFFVAIQIMWSAIQEKHGPLKNALPLELVFRTVMVLLTCMHFIRHFCDRSLAFISFSFYFSCDIRTGSAAQSFHFADWCIVFHHIGARISSCY